MEYHCYKNDKLNFSTTLQILYKLELVRGAQIIEWGDNAKKSIERGDDNDDEQDDIFMEIGKENRNKNYEDINSQFLPYLRTQAAEESDSDSSDDSDKKSESDSSSSSSDHKEKKEEPEKKEKAAKKAASSSSSSSSSSSD